MPLVLRLLKDWDAPLQPPDPPKPVSGHFVGRQRERELLSNELLRSRQRSIFVSGYRGVGKTSLVYQALHDVLDAADDRKFVTVIMNAAQLQAEASPESEAAGSSDDAAPSIAPSIAPREILLNLIRRLFTRVRHIEVSPDAKAKMNALYNKAIAREFSEKRHERAEQTSEVIQALELKTRLNVNARRVASVAIGLAAGLLASRVDVIMNLGVYAPAAIAVLGALTGDLIYTASVKRVRQLSRATLAETLYSIDASLGNLEFELEELHAMLDGENYTVIYVLDELDKLRATSVLEVLQYFKHLFTLSSAIFVFVGGEELIEEMLKQKNDSKLYRNVDYTFFTSRYFLGRASVADLADYIDRVRAPDVLSESSDALLVRFKKLVAFNSHADFFDLGRELRDRVTSFDGLLPVIEIARFTDAERTRIALQDIIDLVYGEKYYASTPSRWNENEAVLRALYDAAHRLVDAHEGAAFPEPGDDSPSSAAVRDLYTVLSRQEVLISSAAKQVVIRGVDVQIHEYSLAALGNAAPQRTLGFFSEHELRFLGSYERMLDRVAHTLNFDRWFRNERLLTSETVRSNEQSHLRRLKALGTDVEALLPSAQEAYAALHSPAPAPVVAPETFEVAVGEVEEAVTLLESRLVDQVAEIFGSSDEVLELGWDEEDAAGIDRRLVESFPTGSFLLGSLRGDRRLVLTPSLSSAMVRRNKELFRQHAAVLRTVVLAQSGGLRGQKPKGLRIADWRGAPPNEGLLAWSAGWLTRRDG